MYQFSQCMELSPEDSLPPPPRFYSDSEPIDVAVDEPPTDTEEEEFRTPAAPKLAFNYRLRSRTVKPSARSRTRRNT